MKATLTTAVAVLLAAGITHSQSLARVPSAAEPRWESCEEMHDMYVQRFEGLQGFGLSRMLQPPMFDRSGVLDDGKTLFSLESIELVGLLKLDTPVVYVPTRHGDRPQPEGFKSRTLTNFEQQSLAAFHQGRDMASAGSAKALRCVGALRAKESCLRCHKDRKIGDLLGAFTYTLRSRPAQ